MGFLGQAALWRPHILKSKTKCWSTGCTAHHDLTVENRLWCGCFKTYNKEAPEEKWAAWWPKSDPVLSRVKFEGYDTHPHAGFSHTTVRWGSLTKAFIADWYGWQSMTNKMSREQWANLQLSYTLIPSVFFSTAAMEYTWQNGSVGFR